MSDTRDITVSFSPEAIRASQDGADDDDLTLGVSDEALRLAADRAIGDSFWQEYDNTCSDIAREAVALQRIFDEATP